MRRRIIPALLAAILLTGCGAKPAKQETQSIDLFAMDTYMNLKATGTDPKTALNAAAKRIEALESTLSVTDETSDLWAVNHAEGAPVQIAADTANILQAAQQMHKESGGALSVSMYPVVRAWGFTTGEYQVPAESKLEALLSHVDDTQIDLNGNTLTVPAGMELDLGALAKGYTSDAVMEIFRDAGIRSAVISLGGNVQTLGTKADGSLWRVGIADPLDPDRNIGVLEVADKAVITSGNYERFFTDEAGNVYWHILDPSDGRPADNGLISVTVIGDSGLACDALSTALFVEGTDRALDHWRRSRDFELVLVTDDGKLLVTEGIADAFTPRDGITAEVIAP